MLVYDVLHIFRHIRLHYNRTNNRPQPEGGEAGINLKLIAESSSQSKTDLFSGMKRLILDVLIGSELLSYRTEVLYLIADRFLREPNSLQLSCGG